MFQAEIKSRIGEDICILIRLDNHSVNYICDCGDASDLGVKDCQNTEVIFISHTHIDHFVNFDTILRHQLGIGKRVKICGPLGLSDQVGSRLQSYTWNLIEANAIVYEVREIVSKDEILVSEYAPPKWEKKDLGKLAEPFIYSNDRFEVAFEQLDHKIPSVAYFFKERDRVKIDLSKSNHRGGKWVRRLKEAYENGQEEIKLEIEGVEYCSSELYDLLEIKQGDSLGVIMDHAASKENHEKIRRLFSGCRQVFIECFYKDSDKEYAKLNYHSYATASGRIMKEIGVKTAIPVHFSRKYDQTEIEELLAAFKQALTE